MNDSDLDGQNNVCILVFGEYGHVVSFVFAESETDTAIQQLLYFIRN